MRLSDRWNYIEQVARARLAHNKTKWHVSKYGRQLEVLGAAGELAAHRFLGLSDHLFTGFDGGVDLTWRGYTVDVKATRLTNLSDRHLQWRMRKPIKADVILLIAVDLSQKLAVAVGWVWGKDLKKAPINKDRDIPCREIPVTKLRPFWELYTLEAKCS